MLTEPGKLEYQLPPHERVELVLFGNRALSEEPLPEIIKLRASDVEIYGKNLPGIPSYYAVRDSGVMALNRVPAEPGELKVVIWRRIML